ncbi:MAG TPA: hypothetical protein PKI36_16110, partial [Turneriella sp.]|nr:hypothetical protein [Turneriella sp.]
AAEASIKAIFTILDHILRRIKIQLNPFRPYIPEFPFLGGYHFQFRSGSLVNNGHYSRDRSLMVENRDFVTILHMAQIFAQVRFEFRYRRS